MINIDHSLSNIVRWRPTKGPLSHRASICTQLPHSQHHWNYAWITHGNTIKSLKKYNPKVKYAWLTPHYDTKGLLSIYFDRKQTKSQPDCMKLKSESFRNIFPPSNPNMKLRIFCEFDSPTLNDVIFNTRLAKFQSHTLKLWILLTNDWNYLLHFHVRSKPPWLKCAPTICMSHGTVYQIQLLW